MPPTRAEVPPIGTRAFSPRGRSRPCLPATRRPTSDRPLTAERRDALAAFYTDHAERLKRRVALRCGVYDDELIADASAFAWLQLARRPDVTLDRQGLRWMTLVGTQEAWRLATRCERPAGTFTAADPDRDAHELPDPPGPAVDPIERVIAREQHRARVARLVGLTPAQRLALLLQAAGYDYREIMRLTACTYSAVNRHLRVGRRAVRSEAGRRA
jgi:DNA-directed RNA polymerase specialized sigma24 family protein